MKSKHIYIFIGPKGSGKSFLGELIEKEFKIKSLNTESIFKGIQTEGITTAENIIQAYDIIEKQIDEYLVLRDEITFETTGVADEFWLLLKRLEKKYRTYLISVYAPENVCIERIKKRNAGIHITIDEASIRQIHLLCCSLEYKADMQVFTANFNHDKFIDDFIELTKT